MDWERSFTNAGRFCRAFRSARLLRRLSGDESGQATAEYMLVMSIMLAMTVVVLRNLLRPIYQRMRAALGTAVDEKLFPRGEALHQLRLPR